MDFSSVTLSFFVHSTEDGDRLLEEIRRRIELKDDEISREIITGYFGNEIISVKARIIGERAQSIAVRILSLLSKTARSEMRTEIEKSLDEHDSLYLRLDRQTLWDSSLSISDQEPLRIKLKPRTRSGGRISMKEQYEELLK